MFSMLHALLFVIFSYFWCRALAATVIVALPGPFIEHFYIHFSYLQVYCDLIKKIKALATKIPRHCAHFWYSF